MNPESPKKDPKKALVGKGCCLRGVFLPRCVETTLDVLLEPFGDI